jgi:methylmalonyl-CoA/ethylmalonyl-CoA epimerase
MTESIGGRFKLETVDHIGIVVRDCEKVSETWERMFGIGPWTFTANTSTDAEGNPIEVRLAFGYMGDLELELIEIKKGKILHSEFLEEHGEGLHHLGFFVDDVDGEAARLVERGAEIILQRPGQWIYLDCGGPGGVIFELMQRRGKITGR